MQPTHNPPTTTPPLPPVATILYRAAEYLRRHGWRQGARFDLNSAEPYPAACATGAIDAAITGHTGPVLDLEQTGQADTAIWWLATTLHDQGLNATWDYPDALKPRRNFTIVLVWNDARGRSAAEVIAMLQQAAATWELIHGGPCRSDLCIASFCDGIHHVDATGNMWTDDIRPGTASADPS